ncbi:MAG: sulfotransferase family protein [Desulfobacteraceae bacterium]|nr:sulfotransferase family protein [Desulfobacteraceae bacterium]
MKHQRYDKVLNPKNKRIVTKEQYNNYFKFTIVRNPWDRAFSWYKNVMRDEIHQKGYGISSDISLNFFLKNYAGKGMLRPQTCWLKNYKGKIPMDYIGRFEDLQNTFIKIKQFLNLDQIEFSHEIKGSGENYKEFYDEESKAIVNKVYSKEIDMCNGQQKTATKFRMA